MNNAANMRKRVTRVLTIGNRSTGSFLLVIFQLFFLLPLKGQHIVSDSITLGLTNENMEAAIKKIEQQTVFHFYYRKADIDPLQHLYLQSATRTIDGTLHELLQNSFLNFRQIDNHILLEKTQQTRVYEITGRAVSIDQRAIEFATIEVEKTEPHRIIPSIMADTGGYFKLTISEMGNYRLDVSAAGMDKLVVAVDLGEVKSIQLPTIVLTPAGKQLKEVSVIAQKPYIEEKLDRTIVNVGSLISNTGANALEALEKAPGVIVDGKGNISFKGKTGVLILIDGKPTYLSGDNLTDYLKSLPSSLLDQIELMDNPPAKYDAAGNAGVINIKTKRSKAEGFNGSLSASYGEARYGQSNESVNLNYKAGKMNIFANASYGINHGYRTLDLDRHYFDGSGNLSAVFDQTEYINSINHNSNGRFGIDYLSSAKTTWGILLTGNLSLGSANNPSSNNIYDGKGDLDSVENAKNTSRSHHRNGGINLNYSHQFDSSGKLLTFDLDYLKYQLQRDQSFLNSAYDPQGNLTSMQEITDHLPTGINIYSAKTDFSMPLGGKAKMEVGLKSSYVNTDNAANYYDLNNEVSTIDYNFSNQFLYRENINAAYVNFNKSYRRLEWQAGLRLENTNSSGHQLGNPVHPDSSFKMHYTDLFPTAYISYKLDRAGSNLLGASYGRRIGRPYYQDLNPFVTLSDKFTYSAGNPYLRPQFADNYKLSYSYKNILTTAVFYNRITDLQNEVIRQQGIIFIDGTGNIGVATYLGVSANLALQPAKWWSLNVYAQELHNHFKGQLYSTYLDQSSTYCLANMTSQFTLPHGWSAELDGYYTSRFANGQSVIAPFGQLNGGVQKKILHDRGSLKFSARDILHTYVADGVNNFIAGATSTFRNRFNTQTFTLGFSYTFGKSSNKQKRDTQGAGTEQNRVRK
jgi:hypothetical protein